MKLRSSITLLAITLALVISLGAKFLPAQAMGSLRDHAAAAPQLQATPTPVLFAQFDAAANGFGFQNYGASFPEGDLTVAEVREMFGNRVCRRLDGTHCVPGVETQLWTDTMNQHMAGGHCNGFTVLSHRLFAGEFAAQDFSTAAETVFEIEQNVPIMRRIAQSWTQQTTDEILNAEFWGTPQAVIDALQATTEPVELKLYFGNLGHSVLAYGLQDMGNDIYRILIYDNNWPGREDLYVEVDYAANAWRYSLAAVNPDEDSDIWQGDSKSWPPNLVFVPLSAYATDLTCPFCTLAASTTAKPTKTKTTSVSLTGAGDFLVRDDQGRYSGIWAGAAIGNIPGSRLLRFVGAPSTKSALVSLPAEEKITVHIGTTGLAQEEPGDLRMISPGFSAALDDLVVTQSRTEALAFSATTRSITYTANSHQNPVFKLAIQGEDGTDYLFVLAGVAFQPDTDLSLAIDPDNGLVLTSDTLQANDVKLIMARLGPTGETIFASAGIVIGGGKTAVDYANWNGLEPLAMQIDADGDGAFDQPLALANAFPQAVLAGATSGASLITLLNEIAPYMDQTETAALLDALAVSALDGDDYGRLLLALPELDLSDDRLTGFFDKAALPPEELATAIHAVRRDDASRAALLEQLNLPAADQATVEDKLQALNEVHEVLVDFDFLDPARHEQVETLVPFVVDRGLDAYQIANLLEQLGGKGMLIGSEKEALLTALDLSPDIAALVQENLSAAEVIEEIAAVATPAETTPVAEVTPTPTVAEALAPTPTPAPPTPTPLPPTPTSAPVTAAGQLTFEAFGTWRRGEQPYGTFTQSKEPVQEGGFAGKLTYDFSAATDADDFVIFTQRIALPGEPNLLQAWVYGDGSGHLFNIWIEDANGEVWSVALGPVAHTGWQQVTGVIDANAPWPGGRVYGPDNGAIDYPIRFLGLVIDRIDGTTTGMLSFDNITFSAGDSPVAPTEPSVPTETPIPAPTDATNLCADIPASTQADVMVRFVNQDDSVGILYWRNFDDQLQEFARINPGEAFDQETFEGHQWEVYDTDPQGVDDAFTHLMLNYIASAEEKQCAVIKQP